jgi:uncharacterized protein (UPF0305 family)
MSDNLEKINFSTNIMKKEILLILKKEASNIHISDIMKATSFLRADSRYVPTTYRNEYITSYTKAFITRIKELKDDNTEFYDDIDSNELQKSLKLLNEQEINLKMNNDFNPIFFKIYKLISIYTTFILNEPIHPVGTPFPGGFKVRYENERYLCPVKEKQKDNPGAVCGFCIAEQDEKLLLS